MESNQIPENIKRLTDYINKQQNPNRILWALRSLIEPRLDNIHNGDKEV